MRSLAILLLLSTPACAIDFDQKLLAPDAKTPLCLDQGDPCPADKLATLRLVSVTALYAQFKGEENLSGDIRYKRGKLADSVMQASGDVKLKSEEVSMIKDLIGKAFGPLVVKQAWDMLEGEKK